jgi:hypothetical protein
MAAPADAQRDFAFYYFGTAEMPGRDVVLDQLALAPSILTRMGVPVPATMKAKPFMLLVDFPSRGVTKSSRAWVIRPFGVQHRLDFAQVVFGEAGVVLPFPRGLLGDGIGQHPQRRPGLQARI